MPKRLSIIDLRLDLLCPCGASVMLTENTDVMCYGCGDGCGRIYQVQQVIVLQRPPALVATITRHILRNRHAPQHDNVQVETQPITVETAGDDRAEDPFPRDQSV